MFMTIDDRRIVLEGLCGNPSVASAVAIGHFHVLNGTPVSTALEAFDALEEMLCDWTVAILDRALSNPT